MRRDGWTDRTIGKKIDREGEREVWNSASSGSQRRTNFHVKSHIARYFWNEGHPMKKRISCILHACHDTISVRNGIWSIERRPMERFKPYWYFRYSATINFHVRKSLLSLPFSFFPPTCQNLCKLVVSYAYVFTVWIWNQRVFICHGRAEDNSCLNTKAIIKRNIITGQWSDNAWENPWPTLLHANSLPSIVILL